MPTCDICYKTFHYNIFSDTHCCQCDKLIPKNFNHCCVCNCGIYCWPYVHCNLCHIVYYTNYPHYCKK